MTPLEPPLAEAARVLRICNACRYCEGYCATFAAMTRRLEFTAADLHYLANLCHHCGACLHACQYAPPHEFSVNVPRALASVRLQTYQQYAWPPTFARLYERQGMFVAVVLATSVAAFLAFVIALHGGLWHRPLAGDFYAVLPHGWMVGLFGPVFLYALLALGIGVWRFWHGAAPGVRRPDFAAALAAARDVATLRNLHGGHGEGCPNEDDRPTQARRLFHHLTFYGFLLCFAATTVATVYHYAFHWPAPYPLLSAPVLLGTAGGIGLLIGPAGLLWLHLQRDPLHGVPAQAPLDRAFLALLFATSASGLALLAGRDTRAMAMLLALHLGCVLALFLTLPYGKFAHAVYRGAALLKWAIERRRPSALRLVND
ncbi:MAG: tricarballylate utilization 4Fe-4S protein TcuB [Sutterellaceae bacterium]|nr:tricarballylate utilization 4Fe-4S protein TcuB [Burkholderiaceae bacterium]MDW8429838.1 tricarballylate utilization 4Fe-4S protein TcuB [Sutterellaceae bacterium]